jgi:MFS family permease
MADTTATPAATRPPFAHRLRIYVMMIGYIFSIKVPRFAINSLVPFIVAQYGMPSAAVASLLAAFHPGYVASMIPGGGATVRWGSKPVIQLGVLGTAATLALMPVAGRLGRPALTLSAVMVFMGLTQGPMSPALGQMSRDWMPTGEGAAQIEKAWSQRFQMLSHTAAPAVAAFLTPRLCDRYSWQSVCYTYAGAGALFGTLWQLAVTSKPPAAAAAAAAPSAADKTPAAKPPEEKNSIPWHMFKLPSVRALMMYHIAFDNMNLSLGMLAPTYFVQKFGITPVQMSGYVSAAQIAHVPAGFAVTFIESVLVKRGVRALSIRKWMTCLGSFLEAIAALAYGVATTPLQAATAYALCDSASQLHSSGAWPNYYEVGGEDTAMLNAVDNTFASSTAIVVPYMGFAMLNLTGSWLPHMAFGSLLKIISGVMFAKDASVTTAREQLAQRAAARQKK